MNTKDLMKIALAIYSDEIVVIEDDEVRCYGKFFNVDNAYKFIFNPEEDGYQFDYCEEYILKHSLNMQLRKLDNVYWCYISHHDDEGKDMEMSGETRTEAILNALLEVIEND